MDKEIKKNMQTYYDIGELLFNCIREKSNFGKECFCNPDETEFFLYIDIELVATPYCLSCGGVSVKEPVIECNNEEVGIPQIRKNKDIADRNKEKEEKRIWEEKYLNKCINCGKYTINKEFCYDCRRQTFLPQIREAKEKYESLGRRS